MHTNSLPPTDREETQDSGLKTQDSPVPSNLGFAATQGNANLRIPGDVVNRATADLADNQRSAIRRYHAYYIEQGLSLTDAAELLYLSPATLGLVFRGKYEAKLDNVVAVIERFFELEDRRSQGRKLQFIETKLTKRVCEYCDTILQFQRIGFIFGDSQVGKTINLLAYARTHNHGSTIYVRMPTGGHISYFLAALAKALRISDRMKQVELRQRIIEAFDSRMLLIVDEAHQCLPANTSIGMRYQTIEFIREIFDVSECGVVISATRVFEQEMERGALQKLLQQLKRRRFPALAVPDRPTQADLNTFAAAFGLPPSSADAHKLEQRMIADEALGMWLTLLRMAAKLAAQRKQKLDWAHVLSAHAGLEAMEKSLTN
jgi:DNA transposition AAA+ family ATPase